METFILYFLFSVFRQFKSYYVVWKLVYVIPSFMFPSSLNRTMQYGNAYFVSVKVPKTTSLNRTMQYGNFGIVDPPDVEKKGLNRTMQYGNLRHAHTLLQRRPGLNRTMQYGNLDRYKGEAMADAV